MPLTTTTYFFLKNNTNVDIIRTEVPGSSFDGYDFYGKDRPDKNLVGRSIGVGKCICVRLELRDGAKYCPFTMKLTFKDCSKDEFTINQKWAFKDDCYRLETYNSAHVIRLERHNEKKNSLLVTIENTQEQRKQIMTDELILQATKLTKKKKYLEACNTYKEAILNAAQQETIYIAQVGVKETTKKMENEEAKNLNKQAVQLMKNNNCEEASNLYRQALTLANEKPTIDEINKTYKKMVIASIKEYMKKAKDQINQGQYDAAISELDRAKSRENAVNDTKIQRELEELFSRAYTESGIIKYNKAKLLEQDGTKDNANEARKLLDEAKRSLEKAVANKRTSRAEEYLKKLA